MSQARYIIILFIFAMILLSGCSVHRQQAVEPPGPVPGSFIGQTGPHAEELPIGRWWETFEDENLSALMDESFDGNLDLVQSFAILKQLLAVRRQASSVRYPSLDVEGQASRSRQPGIFGDDTGNSYSLSLAAGYEVDLWNRLKSGDVAATLEAEASREDIKSLYISLSAELVDLYYLAVEQRAQLDLTDGTIASFEETLDLVTRRYVRGLVPALDVYQARQNLFLAKASRPLFEANLKVAEHAIATLLGRYPEHGLAGKLAELPETPAAFPVGIPSQVLTRRPDVKAEFLRVKASDARVAEAIADRFPSINLLGSYGTSKTAFSSGDISGVFWTALASVIQPVIDGGRRRAEVARTRAQFEENLARYQKTVLTSVQEVEDALIKNRTTEERIRQLKERVEATAGSLRLSKERYLLGLSDYLPILTAQTANFTAESQLLAARRQLISDRISLARALGGDWMEKEVENRLEASNNKGSEK
jgi:NodT family efflux transporter outer membrane factor (OMF) lipoprotein